jgi:hypothetical protein
MFWGHIFYGPVINESNMAMLREQLVPQLKRLKIRERVYK